MQHPKNDAAHDEYDEHCGHEHGELEAGDEQPQALLLGYGDIASRVAPLLQDIGFAVTGVRRQPEKAEAAPEVNLLAADVQDAAAVAHLLAPSQGAVAWDVIVVTLTPSEYSPEGYQQAYVRPMQHLVKALAQQPNPPLILYVSSTSVYGQRDGSWVDENTLAEPNSGQGDMLLAAENELLTSGLPVVILRAAGIYGPGRERMYAALQRGEYTITPTWHNRIHANDLAAAIEHLALQHFMGAELDKVYIVCENTPLYGENYVRQLAHELELDGDRLLATLPRSNEVSARGSKRLSNARLRATGWEPNQ